jgi:hypothetical protein
MTRPTFVQHGGRTVLVVDYSRAKGTVLAERVAEAGRIIRRQPQKSLLILARVVDLEFSADSTKLLLDHIKENEPYSLATAVVGLGHLSGAVPVANRLTGRQLNAFDDEAEALDWLASIHGDQPVDDENVRFIDHGGESILWIDFRGASTQDLEARMKEAASIIRAAPPNSVLTLTLLHGLSYNEETTAIMKDYVSRNRPYVLAAAVVGLDYLRRIVLPLNRLTGRRLRAFDDIDSERDCLVSEKKRKLGI